MYQERDRHVNETDTKIDEKEGKRQQSIQEEFRPLYIFCILLHYIVNVLINLDSLATQFFLGMMLGIWHNFHVLWLFLWRTSQAVDGFGSLGIGWAIQGHPQTFPQTTPTLPNVVHGSDNSASWRYGSKGGEFKI